MNESSAQIVSIFGEALDCQSPEERAAYLDRVCGNNADLRAKIEALLQAHHEAGDFLRGPAASSDVAATGNRPSHEQPGTIIGPYKLLEQIGEGGMGVVYMADQQAPVRRRVALKIIKPGMDTRQVIARFEAERQALALMDHSNIARVLDAGATDSGRPYFVMELVRGIPITEYCDQNNLPVHERLQLFVQVCHAVQHAHQKGIIHRDIKPSNVLVTLDDGRAVPKVIDFGVAKAINQQLTEKTLFTNFAQMIGTPLYMSPEQAEMTSNDIDTRSDIYSMGVLLYELLTGTTPFDQQRLREAAYDEIRRIIREEEPPKPSTRISTLGDARTATAAHRQVDAHRLSQLVRGDLDWIVMKALEKDRTHRYDTANSLALDVERYLTDQPVEACPPSAAYRFRKFARRNRAALITTALIAGALVLGTVVSTWQAIRATRAERIAEDQRTEAEQQRAQAEANFQKAPQAVDEYFTLVSESTLFNVPELQPLRKELLEAALRFYQGFAQDRTNDPAVLADLAVTYLRVCEIDSANDRNDDAIAALDRALDIIERLRREHPRATEQHRRLAGYYKGLRSVQGAGTPRDLQGARKSYEHLMDTWRKFAEENPSVIGFRSDLASIYFRLGVLLADGHVRQNAVPLFRNAHSILEKLAHDYPAVPEYRADLAFACGYLALNLYAIGSESEAEAMSRQCFALWEQLAADFPGIAQYRIDLALGLDALGELLLGRHQPREAEVAYRRSLTLREQLAAEFPNIPDHRVVLADSLSGRGNRLASSQPQEAEVAFRRSLTLYEQLVAEFPNAPEYRVRLTWRLNQLGALLASSQPQEAEIAFRRSLTLCEQLVAELPNDPNRRADVARKLTQLGKLLKGTKPQEAESAYHRAIGICEKIAADFPDKAEPHRELAALLTELGRDDEAIASLRRAIELDLDPNQGWRYYQLGDMFKFTKQNKDDMAIVCYRKALDLDPSIWGAHSHLAELLSKQNKMQEALAEALQAVRQAPNERWPNDVLLAVLNKIGDNEQTLAVLRENVRLMPDSAQAHIHLGMALKDQQHHDEAMAAFCDALKICEKLTAEFPSNAESHYDLSNVLGELGRDDEAVASLRHAVELAPDKWWWHANLGDLLVKQHKDDEAIASYRIAVEFDPKNYGAHSHLSEVLARQNKMQEALAEARQAVRLAPNDGWPRDVLLRVLNQIGDNEQTLAILREDVRLTPDSAQAHIHLGFALRQQEQAEDAIASLRHAVELAPNNWGWHKELAVLLVKQHKNDEAIASYRKAAEHDPNPQWEHVWIAELLAKQNKTQEALAEARQAVRLAPNECAARDLLWDVLNRIGDKEQTLAIVREDVGLTPNGAHAHYHLGVALSDQQQAEEAIAEFRRAIEICEGSATEPPASNANSQFQPRLPSVYSRLVNLLEAQGHEPEAEALLRESISVLPKQLAAYQRLAEFLARQHRFEEAQAAIRDAGEPKWDDESANNNLAWFLATCPQPELRDPTLAIKLARKAIHWAPSENAMYRNTLGVAQYRAGKWEESIESLQKAEELAPGKFLAFNGFFLAMSHQQLSHNDEARGWYDRSVEWMEKQQPANEELRRFRAEAAELLGIKDESPPKNKEEPRGSENR